LAIDGSGFFIVRGAAAGGGGEPNLGFTRAGSFKPDAEGFLRSASGQYLQGWKLDAQGRYADTGSAAALVPVRVSDAGGRAEATTAVSFRANLASTTPASSTYAAGDLASGQAAPAFARSVEVYDAQGVRHRLTLGTIKTGTNTWAAEIYAEPASDVSAADGLLASGTLAFRPDGTLDEGASSPALLSPVAATWTSGAAPSSIRFALAPPSGGLTQFGTTSALISSSADGGMLGNIASMQVSRDGKVNVVFDDGSTRALYQLPIATFPNADGLARDQGNTFRASNDSGAIVINAAGRGGAGQIAAGALEASTVDLASEFAEMIKTQRAYSASSRVVTTVDEMLQEAANLKR
jgi:flagellar hook protein FlgE